MDQTTTPRHDVAKRDEIAEAIFLSWVAHATSPEAIFSRLDVAQRQAEIAFKIADLFMVEFRKHPRPG